MDSEHSLTGRARWPLLLAIAVLSALGGWLVFGGDDGHETDVEVTPPDLPTAVPDPAPPPERPAPARPIAAAAAADRESGTEMAAALPPSHPITPAHVRIQLENQFIQAMNDAMDLREGARLRKLASQYREHHFEDVDKLGEGYDIVANCLLYPGDASKSAAQAFFDRERASILRRHVKRHCLE
jgi:hypothetical protein